MKKFVKVVLIIILLLAIGGGIAWHLGNKPEVIHYPNGKIKSIAQRKFFQKNGEYSLFTQNGVLSQQYNLVKGVKNGKAKIYTSYFMPIEVDYVNGVMSGPVTLNKSDLSKTLEDFKLNIEKNKTFKLSAKDKEFSYTAEGKFLCEDEVLIENLQNFINDTKPETLKPFLACLSSTAATVNSPMFQCSYTGEYKFPKYTSEAKFVCDGEIPNQEYLNEFKKIHIEANFDPAQKAMIFKTYDLENPLSVVSSKFKGIEEIIEESLNFVVSADKEKMLGHFASKLIKNMTFSDTVATYDNNKITSIKGDFNIVTGFSNPYVISYYTNNNPSSQIKVTDKGVSVKFKYPSTNKPMMALAVNVDEAIKSKYKDFINALLTDLEKTEDAKDSALNNLMSQMTTYALTFSDVIKSANVIVWNKKGEKIIAGAATVNGKIAFQTLIEDMAQHIDFKIVTYKGDKPENISAGNLFNGFTINNEPATVEEVYDMVMKSEIKNTLDEIEAELHNLYKDVKINILQGQYTPVDPMLFGMYTGYVSAMKKHVQNKTAEQASSIISNIKILYSTSENYAGLSNASAISLGIIPEDMIVNVGSPDIRNAAGGYVTIKSSKDNSTDSDEHKAFVVEFGGLSKDNCVSLATSYYMIDSTLVGTATGRQKKFNSAEEFSYIGNTANLIYFDLDKTDVRDGWTYASKANISFANAIRACSGEGNTNSVAFKYH